DLFRGLALLGPKLEQMSGQLDLLSAEFGEQKSALQGKASAAEVATAGKTEQLETDNQRFYAHVEEQLRSL
ncbi:unnamed protein product, partial [Polarella glacialis]